MKFICRNKRSIQENIHAVENLKYQTSEPPTGNLSLSQNVNGQRRMNPEVLWKSGHLPPNKSWQVWTTSVHKACERSARASMLFGGKTAPTPRNVCSPRLNKLSLGWCIRWRRIATCSRTPSLFCHLQHVIAFKIHIVIDHARGSCTFTKKIFSAVYLSLKSGGLGIFSNVFF